MTEQMIQDALRDFAEQAAPVPGMAERALRRHRRRRRVRTTGTALAAAGLTALVVLPFAVPSSGGETRRVAASSGLPDNTPAERAVARGCLRGASDAYRLLNRIDLGADGFVAWVGNNDRLMLCSGNEHIGNMEGPSSAAPWIPVGPPDPELIQTPMRVDIFSSVSVAVSRKPNNIVFLLAGRAKPGVQRIDVTWSDGRTLTASLRNGYFLSAHWGRTVPDPTATGDLTAGAARTSTEHPTRVVAYDRHGQILQVLGTKLHPREVFDNGMCAAGEEHPLCHQ
ncbi:hypothetical protein AB0L06_40775 [Spirillospora sp. NPDC052269]